MSILNLVDDINKLGIENIKSKISPFDSFTIVLDLLNSKSNILGIFKQYKKSLNTDIHFNFLYNTIVNQYYLVYILLGNNHYDNPFLNINFILGNPYLFDLEMFDILYKKRQQIKVIPNIIKKCWKFILISDLRNFFNNELISKWLSTSNFKKLTKEEILAIPSNTEETYIKYCKIFKIFDKANKKNIKYIKYLATQITTTQNPGCYNLNNEYYFHCLRIHTGLQLNLSKINILLRWAEKELNRLLTEMKEIIKQERPDLVKYTISDIIKNLDLDQQYKYKTKDEFINHHKEIMATMNDFFINIKQIKEYVQPNLTIIDNKDLAGAYWAYDTFYLNTYGWEKINRYQALALTLHEAVPGHHTQVSYAVHDKSDGYDVLYSWFGTTSGFHEGWALFTEKLSPKYTNLERIGQLQYEILRTLRVIVDISIHIGGKSPSEIIQYMKTYLAMPDKSIESEVYRYVTIPGQALGYKLGAEIFRKIHKKIIKDGDLLSDQSIELYKTIIYEKAKPLEILMQQYNLTFDEIFNI